MEEEGPSRIYAVEARANEEMELEKLEPFIITEGIAESSGYYSFTPLSDFILYTVIICSVSGILAAISWLIAYPQGDWFTPAFFTAITVAWGIYGTFKIWETAHGDG